MTRYGGPIRSTTTPNNREGTLSNAVISQSGSREAGTAADAFGIQAVANAASANMVLLKNASHGQATTHTFSDPGVATVYVREGLGTAGAVSSANTFRVDVTAGFAALATAGKVNIVTHPTATARYKVRDIQVRYAAAGLSGGGGDRLLKVTDGTTSYNNAGITAAVLGTPVNTVWGGTGNPVPGTVDMATQTVAGADLYLQYGGGTTDFTAGSISVTVEVEQTVA